MNSLHLMPDADKPSDPREPDVRSPGQRLGDDVFEMGCLMNAVAASSVMPSPPRRSLKQILDEDGQLTINLLVEEHGVEKVYRWLENAASGYGVALPILPPTGDGR